MSIAENVKNVQERVSAAARAAGRDPASVTLVAATKMNDADKVREAIRAGIRVCGENRVQELVAKSEERAYGDKTVHLIGHLQTNKLKKVLGRASLIQSVDSARLLDAINAAAGKLGIRQAVLLEINIGGEESKTGIAPDTLLPLLEAAAAKPHITVKGLMAIPPVNTDDAANRTFFAAMRELAAKAEAQHYANVTMDELSMGMSDDYENAVREGATIVRIGTAIYGARDYGPKA